ncbi:MAG: preQ(1) synthase [Desulfosalsimonas sp.]
MNNEKDEKRSLRPFPPDVIETGMLEPISYDYSATRDIDIVIEQPEYTSLCPRTGLPDFGRITISYTPGNWIIELKSLKYYLLQYRNVGIFYENAVNRILEDLVDVLSPKKMAVVGEFTSRGGISTTVTAHYPAW